MFGFTIFLWFITSLLVVGYGLSNGAVPTLKLPRWSSLAIVGAGACMLIVMSAVMTSVSLDVVLFDSEVSLGGGARNSGGD